MIQNKIVFTSSSAQTEIINHAKMLAKRYGYAFTNDAKDFKMCLDINEKIALKPHNSYHMKPLRLDFESGQQHWRQKTSRGLNEPLLRACGIKKTNKPTIVDMTAGLLQDAYQLAIHGADVYAIEQSPIVGLIGQDAIKRLKNKIALELVIQNSLDTINIAKTIDVVYIDPMFEIERSAKVKRPMQLLQMLFDIEPITPNYDLATLFARAKLLKPGRIVIKQPNHASAKINVIQPSYELCSKQIRYLVYQQ